MDRPIITINGDVKTMQNIKARTWREIMKFEDERKNLQTFDAVEKYCEVIAGVFGVTADDVLDNLEISEVLPTYFAVLNCVVAMLTEKLVTDKKNEAEKVEP